MGLGTAALAPLWADPRDPGMNSARLFFMRRHCQMDTFARNWASNFRQIWENRPGHPKAPPRYPKGTQNAVKCDMVSTTCSKMPSNATWFWQHVPKCRQMRHGFDNILIKEYGPYGPQGPWAHKTEMFLLSSYYVVIIILIRWSRARGQGQDPKKERVQGPDRPTKKDSFSKNSFAAKVPI